MNAPRILDLFCCEGGAGVGYANAGFEVIGVDIEPQPRYPFPFIQADALKLMRRLLDGFTIEVGGKGYTLEDFDAIHASPPCQARTKAQKIQGNDHPKLIAPTRDLLFEAGLPYVIENVPTDKATDADPLHGPIVELCGSMFGLHTYRHRWFEIAWPTFAAWKASSVPEHPKHIARTTKMGRPPVSGEYMHVVGNFSGVHRAREIMGMPWASRDGLREAIPPVYTEFIGRQLLVGINDPMPLAYVHHGAGIALHEEVTGA